MAGIPFDLLWCPKPLADCWWQSFLVNGFTVEPLTEIKRGFWREDGNPLEGKTGRSIADLARSKAIRLDGLTVDVEVCQEFEWDRKGVWIHYVVNKRINAYLSRVLLASGAKQGYCWDCCKRLFSIQCDSWSPSAEEFSFLGNVTQDLQALDKIALQISRQGATVSLFVGRYFDCYNNRVNTYAAINYVRQIGRRKLLDRLSAQLSFVLFALGFEAIELGRYEPVRLDSLDPSKHSVPR